MPPYALASHVFACLDQGYVVVLDLKQDRYFSFHVGQTGSLAGFIASLSEDNPVARRLIEGGLLIPSREAGQLSGSSTAALVPNTTLLSNQYEEHPPHRLGYAVSFLVATAYAVILLRFGSLRRAVFRVKKRGARHRDRSVPFNLARTRELVAAFRALQPFLFTSREACLFESLVLIEFLARYAICPNWVFGVQARPFAAHCWVQQGDMVLNDTVEHVTRYTPIMVA